MAVPYQPIGSDSRKGPTLTALFPKWTNKLPMYLAGGSAVSGLMVVVIIWYWFSPRHTDVGYQPHQPIHYSHKLHAGDLGLDCRYCHQNVENGPHATIPTTSTCMNCHSKVRVESDLLAPLRQANESGDPVEWIKVHLLPQYAYFSHAMHVNAGVGCASCHGRIDQMEIVRQVEPLNMGWCLECHRDPAPHLRPYDKITDMAFAPDPEEGARFMEERGINPPTHCSACHR